MERDGPLVFSAYEEIMQYTLHQIQCEGYIAEV